MPRSDRAELLVYDDHVELLAEPPSSRWRSAAASARFAAARVAYAEAGFPVSEKKLKHTITKDAMAVLTHIKLSTLPGLSMKKPAPSLTSLEKIPTKTCHGPPSKSNLQRSLASRSRSTLSTASMDKKALIKGSRRSVTPKSRLAVYFAFCMATN